MVATIPTFCGIDPGAHGAWAVLGGPVGTFDSGDPVAVADALRSLKANHPGLFVALEQTTPFKMGVTGAYRFGGACIGPQHTCAALSIPFVLVRPQAWQREMGLSKDPKERKEQIVQLAQRRWPLTEWPTTKPARSAVADALYLALHLSRQESPVGACPA